jgi:hypothetical protein
MNILTKGLIAAIVVGALVAGVHKILNDRYDAGYAAGQADLADKVRVAQEADALKKEGIGKERDLLARKARDILLEDKSNLEKNLEDTRADLLDKRLLVDRLRRSAAAPANGVQVRADPGPSCGGDGLREQRELVRAGQALAIEGAGLLDEALELVGERQQELGELVALIGYAKRWIAAATVKKDD